MGRAQVARRGQIITIIDGPHNGEKARALEDAGTKYHFQVELISGPDKGKRFNQRAGDYIVGG